MDAFKVVNALAMSVIALNLSYSTLNHTAAPKPTTAVEKVLPVVGRAFSGSDATTGFLVKDGNDYKIVRYDSGSVFSNEAFRPTHISEVTLPNGTVSYAAVAFMPFSKN